jgi:hypothetical protein
MAVPNTSGDRQDVATILAVAVAKVQLLDEALAWRRQAPYSLSRKRQLDTLMQQRESIAASLDSLRRSLLDPLSTAAVVAGLPSPRPEVATSRLANPWWAAA